MPKEMVIKKEEGNSWSVGVNCVLNNHWLLQLRTPVQFGGVLCQLFCPGRLARTGLIHHYYKKLRTRSCPCLHPAQPSGVLVHSRVVLQSQLHSFVQSSRSPGEVNPCRSIPFSPASPSTYKAPHMVPRLPGVARGPSVPGTGCVSPAQPPGEGRTDGCRILLPLSEGSSK